MIKYQPKFKVIYTSYWLSFKALENSIKLVSVNFSFLYFIELIFKYWFKIFAIKLKKIYYLKSNDNFFSYLCFLTQLAIFYRLVSENSLLLFLIENFIFIALWRKYINKQEKFIY